MKASQLSVTLILTLTCSGLIGCSGKQMETANPSNSSTEKKIVYCPKKSIPLTDELASKVERKDLTPSQLEICRPVRN